MELMERDRHLCAVLAQARWLTTQQLWRLAFPGRHRRNREKALRRLVVDQKGAPALVEKHLWVTREGLKQVWGLTAAGYGEAGLLLEEELTPPPVSFEPETMAHHVALTELFVALLAAPVEAALAKVPARLSRPLRQRALAGLFARASHRGWRWTVVGDGVVLPWKINEDGRARDKVLRPDAVLELIPQKKRFFIEAETGTHTVVPRHGDNKPNSTLSKLDRWETYFRGLAEVEPRRTWYEARYPDGYAAEVLFLVHSERRAKTVEDAMDGWRRRNHGHELETRALTLPQFLAELGVPYVAPAAAAARSRTSGSFNVPAVAGVELTAAEANLVVGYVNHVRNYVLEREAEAGERGVQLPARPAGYERMKALARRLHEAQPP